MIRRCFLCKKGELKGKTVTRKGQYKAKGGTGSKISRWTMRRFHANLQKMRIIVKGHPKIVYVCTRCIKKGAFLKAPRRPKSLAI